MTSSVSGSSKSPRKPPVSYRKWMDADNPVCCKCSGVMLELTSWTDSNPSRGFLRCQKVCFDSTFFVLLFHMLVWF
jgi:hypothetical protein